MAWIRLDDQIAQHPKLTACSPSACWLWVTSLSFATRFLTNGFIPHSSLPSLSHLRFVQRYARELVKARLWEECENGFQIHDYLDFNLTAAEVHERRQHDKSRKHPTGIPRESSRNPSLARARSHPIPSHPKKISNLKDLAKLEDVAATTGANGNGGGPNTTDHGTTNRTTNTATTTGGESTARSKRPIYQSDRFVVFEWQFDDLGRLLGSHLDAFDLHAFFDALSKQSRDAGLIIPQRDSGAWLQHQVLTEAQRRGLPIAVVTAPSKQAQKFAGILKNMKGRP